MNILEAIGDSKVFAQHFRGGTWTAWLAFLASLFALPMTDEQRAIFRRHTGRSTPLAAALQEAWLICGRRAGKSFVLALIAVFLACFHDWRPFLGPGEVGTIMIIARDRRQARVIRRFIGGLLHETPMLKRTIKDESVETITLRNSVVIEIHTASFRSTRGYTIIAALLDEVALWPTDEQSADPDVEIINSVRLGMLTIPGSMLLVASSPHMRKGALWNAHVKHYGKDDSSVLVWQAETLEMNPTVPKAIVDALIAEDPARAEADIFARFRSDVEGFVSRDTLIACVGDFFELAPMSGKTYRGYVDAAGGSTGGGDSFTGAIGHRDKDSVIVDAVREFRPPFSPEAVIDELAQLFKSYHVYRIRADRWAGGFPVEQFRKRGVTCEPSEKPKSALYVDLLPALNSGNVTLPKNERLINQLISLERKVVHGGHDSIDHPRGAHDDIANAVAGAVGLLLKAPYDGAPEWMGLGPENEAANNAAIASWRPRLWGMTMIG